MLVGAMRAETTPLLRLLAQPRPLDRRLVLGRRGPHELAVLTCGVGPAKAEARTRAAVAAWRPDRVLNLGTCGALADDLPVGSVLHVERLLDEDQELARLRCLGSPAVTLVTVRRGVWDPATRQALAARGAAACEMEAAGVLRGLDGIELHVLKVVSDQAGAEADGVIPAARTADARPGPLEIARFKARALRLVDRQLLPLVRALLDQSGDAGSR